MGPQRRHQGRIPSASAHRHLELEPSEQFATPSGAACFNTGGSTSYAHGGISLQECLAPVLVVSGVASNAPTAAMSEISWKGLRCNLEVSGGTAGMTADLRREAAGGPSVATTAKPIDDGGARLLVEDDELEEQWWWRCC